VSDENRSRAALNISSMFEKLGDTQIQSEDFPGAMGYYDRCTSLFRTLGGDDYLALARLLGKKSALYMRMGQFRDAVEILTEVVHLFRTKGMPRDHPELLRVTSMLRDARCAAEQQGIDLSQKPSRSRSTNKKKNRGESSLSAASSSSIDLAIAFDKKSEAMRKARRYEEAMEACMGALRIRRELAEEMESIANSSQKKKLKVDIARTLRNQAFLQVKMAEYGNARALYAEALSLYDLCGLSSEHPYVMTAQKELKAIDVRVYEDNLGAKAFRDVTSASISSNYRRRQY